MDLDLITPRSGDVSNKTCLRKHRGFQIMCAIKKIARQEELVPSHASTSECLQRFEEVVRTTLPSRMNGAFMWTGFLMFHVSLVVPVSCRVESICGKMLLLEGMSLI